MLKARVVGAFFLGDRTRLILEGASDEPLTIETSGSREFQQGEEVGVEISRESVLVL